MLIGIFYSQIVEKIVTSVVLFPPPFYFVFYISNLLSFIQNNFSYELARPIMGTIFLVNIYICVCVCTKKIVIERIRDLIYLKFVATDFFPKIISPSAGENSGDSV